MDSTKTALSNSGTSDINVVMSFAYVQGQEAEALAYYEQRLKSTRDPNEWQQLEQIVRKLRLELQRLNKALPDFPLSSLSLKYAA